MGVDDISVASTDVVVLLLVYDNEDTRYTHAHAPVLKREG